MKTGKIKGIKKMKVFRQGLPAFIKPEGIPGRKNKIKHKQKDKYLFLLPPTLSYHDINSHKQDRKDNQSMYGLHMCMSKNKILKG